MALRLSPHLTVMANAAGKAAKRLLRDFNEVEQLQVSVKAPSDFVTQADLRAEQTLREELTKADEGFITGTAAEVTPVGEIGPHNYQVGPLARQMMSDYAATVSGQKVAA